MEATKKLNGTYVVRLKNNIVINEYNPDSLEENEIRISKNSNTLVLDKKRRKITEKVKGWHHYTYSVDADAFCEEGSYQIFVSSKDAAGNRMSSNQKGKNAELKFGVDKTKPVIDILNLENGGNYYSKSKNVKVHVADNLVLKDVMILKNGKAYEADTDNGDFVIPYERKKYEQSLTVQAKDAAGNIQDITYRFYVTKKEEVNGKRKLFLIGGIVVLAGVVAAITVVVVISKRENEELDNESSNQ